MEYIFLLNTSEMLIPNQKSLRTPYIGLAAVWLATLVGQMFIRGQKGHRGLTYLLGSSIPPMSTCLMSDVRCQSTVRCFLSAAIQQTSTVTSVSLTIYQLVSTVYSKLSQLLSRALLLFFRRFRFAPKFTFLLTIRQ